MDEKIASYILDFIKSIYPDENPVPLHAPRFIGNEKEYLNHCIDSTFVSYVGDFVIDFENHIKKLTKAKFAAAIVNGTSALHMTLLGIGVKQNDEVITQALSFAATAAAIKHTGAMPVFVDVDENTLGMSPESLKQFIIENCKYYNGKLINKNTSRHIVAVVPMHTFGHPNRIDEIKKICDEYNLFLIEDAAESLGSYYKGKHTGTFGKAAILSFNGNKPVTTGGGGMVISDDEELILKVIHLSTTAKKKHPWEFFHDQVGYNLRLPNINAALGCAQMEYFDKILENKRETAKIYLNFFDSLNIPFFKEPENSRSNYWLNTIFLKNKEERDFFLNFSNSNFVQTRPVWKLLPDLPPYQDCYCYDIPIARKLEDIIVNIPSSYRK